MRIQADELTSKVADIFGKMGSAQEEATLVADSLVQANLKPTPWYRRILKGMTAMASGWLPPMCGISRTGF